MADQFVYTLTIDHCTGGCGASPFGTITVTDVGANVSLAISLNNAAKFVLTGQAGSTIGFNLNPKIRPDGSREARYKVFFTLGNPF